MSFFVSGTPVTNQDPTNSVDVALSFFGEKKKRFLKLNREIFGTRLYVFTSNKLQLLKIYRFRVVSRSKRRFLGFEPQCTMASLVRMSEEGHCSTL